MRALTVLALALCSATALAEEGAVIRARGEGPTGEWTLGASDRVFLLTEPAATQAPMSFRVGTLDQLATVQGGGSGFYADVFADFAPLTWLTVGGAFAYGNVGERQGERQLAPTVYAKAQLLRQGDGVADVAAQLRYKQLGLGSGEGQAEGELEAALLVQRRVGRLGVSLNAVYGGDFEGKEADAELRGGAGFSVLPNLVVGVDVLGRYELRRGPLQVTTGRSWELTGGPMGALRLDQLTISILAGVTAPMHVASPGVGFAGLLQLGYSL
jgi:hypothetical protein